MRKYLFLFIEMILLQFVRCNPEFISKSGIDAISINTNQTSRIISYDYCVNLSDINKAFTQTHFIYQVGANPETFENLIPIGDNDINRLKKFSARLIKKGHTVRKYSKGDLIKINTSTGDNITRSNFYYLPVSEKVNNGDLVEFSFRHSIQFPFFGFEFSPAGFNEIINLTTFKVIVPQSDKLVYVVENDSITPQILNTDKNSEYIFTWKDYILKNTFAPFAKINTEPLIYTQLLSLMPGDPGENISDSIWNKYSDWYLDMLENKIDLNAARPLADEITAGLSSEKEKMDAIVNYCKQNIRYEQVYYKYGEFIPNSFTEIITRKYGDCKDYSLLIYSLAQSIGIDAKLALVFRGRGVEFHPEIPVSQFNHMLVLYEQDGNKYWYDGTNRTSLPEVTTTDIINQKALILERNKSHIENIDEQAGNRLYITGQFNTQRTNLIGNLVIQLSNQYAVEFSFAQSYLNQIDMADYVCKWLKSNLHNNLQVKSVNWNLDSAGFKITVSCQIPSAIIQIGNNSYIRLNSILNRMIPYNVSTLDPEEVFYNPLYSHVTVDLAIMDQFYADNDNAVHWNFNYDLPPGPFQKPEIPFFIGQIKSLYEIYTASIQCHRKELP